MVALNDTVAIDLPTLIETRMIVQANSGGGKSWAIRRILEQSHGKVQQIVIDVEGSFRSLREKLDYVLLGAQTDEVDYPITPENAALLESRSSNHLSAFNISTRINSPTSKNETEGEVFSLIRLTKPTARIFP